MPYKAHMYRFIQILKPSLLSIINCNKLDTSSTRYCENIIMKILLAIAFVIMNLSTFSNANIFPEDILPPEVVNIQLKSFSAKENSAVFDVTLFNPNHFKLPLREVYGDLYLNDNVIANIEALSKKSLAAHASQIFTVPIIIKPEQLANASTNVIVSGVANYRFKGYMMTPVGELPIEHKAHLTNQQILTFVQTILAHRLAY